MIEALSLINAHAHISSMLYHYTHDYTMTNRTIFHFPIRMSSDIQEYWADRAALHGLGADISLPQCLSERPGIWKRSNAQAESDLQAEMFGSIVKVPSPGPPIFFPIDACSLGSSPHCTEVCCSLPHAFTFENVCCQAKEMTSPQYKMLAKLPLLFVFTVVVFPVELQFAQNGTRFCEWL